MKKIGELVLRGLGWFFDSLFEFLILLSEDDDESDGDWPKPNAKCHICKRDAPGYDPRGEFIVCDNCRNPKPSN